MVGTGGVEDTRNLVNLRLSVARPGRASIVSNSPEDGDKGNGHDGFLIYDVEFVANCRSAQTSGSREDGGLGDGAIAGQRINERLGLLLRVLGRDIGVVAGRRDGGCDGREGAERKSWPKSGGACCASVGGSMAWKIYQQAGTYRARSLRDETPL